MEEVRRASRDVPEHLLGYSQGATCCRLYWTRPCGLVLSCGLRLCAWPSAADSAWGSSPLPYPLILLVLQHLARRITSSELSSLAIHPPSVTQVLFLPAPTTSWANLHCNNHPPQQ